MKKIIFRLLLVALFVVGLCVFTQDKVKSTNANELSTNDIVEGLFEEYYHEGVYKKDTVINLTETAQGELIEYFHAKSNHLVRTTYYSKDALWMSRGDEALGVKYSYYGTSYNGEVANGVTNATSDEAYVTPEGAKVVLSGEGKNSMEEYYTTLFDLLNSNANWEVEGNQYVTTDAKVLGYYLDFTAPCLYSTVISTNYFSYSKATVEVVNDELVLKLWVTSENWSAIKGGVEGVDNVLSQATIHSHDYTEWVETKANTLTENGTETLCCTCGKESSESRTIEAGADYTKEFSNDNSNGTWKYGKVEYHWGNPETFDFIPLTDNNGYAWLGDNIEIKSDWINAGSMMAVAYTASEDANVKLSFKFVGGTPETRLSLRIGIKNSEGVLYSNPEFNGMGSNVLELSREYSLNAGDTIYFILGNENWAEGAYPNGALSISLKPVKALADYTKDFSNVTADGTWKYGKVDYDWGSNDFVLNPLTENNGEAWLGGDVEVKNDWINAGSMMGIAYTATETTNINTLVKFVGGTSETRLSLRIAIKNSEGVLYFEPQFHGMESNVLELSKEYTLNAGDTIYFIFANENWAEGAYPNGNLSITINKK